MDNENNAWDADHVDMALASQDAQHQMDNDILDTIATLVDVFF